jgi:hypothetical protein
VALGQVSSEYFGFPCQSSFHQFAHLSSEAGTIGQKWPPCRVDPVGLHPPLSKLKKSERTSKKFSNVTGLAEAMFPLITDLTVARNSVRLEHNVLEEPV